MRVLVTDDDPVTLALARRQLQQLGATDVQTFESAADALAALAGAADPFDVAICDLNLADIDGVQMLRQLARLRFTGGVLLVTGEDERILRSVAKLARAYGLNVLGALRKPLTAERLRRALATAGAAANEASAAPARSRYRADELAAAIDGGRLVNHYQPQVALATGALIGFEALVRWQHPRDGLLSPDRFIGIAESDALIDRLTDDVLARALAHAREWERQRPGLRLSVNVSARNLAAPDFPERVAQAVAAAAWRPNRLVLEITESETTQEATPLLASAARLRLQGIGLAIDDFGTGFSSLAKLRDLPFDELKLDRGFVRGIARDPALQAIAHASLRMARQLRIRTVAEGIEDDRDWIFLRGMGCDLGQGYLVARPLPADDVPAWIRAWETRRFALPGL